MSLPFSQPPPAPPVLQAVLRIQKYFDLWALLGVPPITGIADCCARAASGHAAAPPSSVMNSRRFIRAAHRFAAGLMSGTLLTS